MIRNTDQIQFESSEEVEEILRVIGEYVSEHPKEKKNEVLKDFYHLLEDMEMEW